MADRIVLVHAQFDVVVEMQAMERHLRLRMTGKALAQIIQLGR